LRFVFYEGEKILAVLLSTKSSSPKTSPMASSHERQLEALEASYRDLLLAALRRCASGQWGLFAHNKRALSQLGAVARSRMGDPSVDELLELGSKIERLRNRFGLESFPLHERFLLMRSSHNSNTLGEPKLAQQWLEELQ
jgi:hypothetical protein